MIITITAEFERDGKVVNQPYRVECDSCAHAVNGFIGNFRFLDQAEDAKAAHKCVKIRGNRAAGRAMRNQDVDLHFGCYGR